MGKRDPNKIMLGGWVDRDVFEAVGAWVDRNRPLNKTHFVFLAAVEKLRREGIMIAGDLAAQESHIHQSTAQPFPPNSSHHKPEPGTPSKLAPKPHK